MLCSHSNPQKWTDCGARLHIWVLEVLFFFLEENDSRAVDPSGRETEAESGAVHAGTLESLSANDFGPLA